MVLEEKLKASRDAEDALRLLKEHWTQSEDARTLCTAPLGFHPVTSNGKRI